MKWLLVALLRIYQIFLSPWLGPRCRFHPSCSEYAIGCLGKYGALKGAWLSFRRVIRCHPYHPGGHDPVP